MFGKNKKLKRGALSVLTLIGLGIILFVALSYFNVNIQSVINGDQGSDKINAVKDIVQSTQTHKNVNYVSDQAQGIWAAYLKVPFSNLYNNYFIPYIWNPFIDNMKRIQVGQPTDFQNLSPRAFFPN
ncbi:hypothetical protein K8Q94_00985 [Candidatus Nomurabacteria bacterium]|nr:hypothetical protein [Candidatus Nomurabacteria bacterium]